MIDFSYKVCINSWEIIHFNYSVSKNRQEEEVEEHKTKIGRDHTIDVSTTETNRF